MTDSMLFKDLPATFPEKDKYQKPSVLGAIAFHILLITALVFVPLLFSPRFEPWVTTMLVAPLPPPPGAPQPPIEVVAVHKPSPAPVVNATPAGDSLVSPAMVPRDIAIVIEEPPVSATGVVGGVLGGVPGGITGGILGGFLAANNRALELADTPPPPLPPAPPSVVSKPIRIGGDVREPKIVKLVSPAYPQLAQTARVSGTVVLEATLTVDGTVDEIRVISGHPLLIDAAIACVKQWQYEPTYLNGSPVAVVLTAKVSFLRKITY